MKILHIIPTLTKGGAERLALDIIKEISTKDTIEARLVIFRNDVEHNISEIKELISVIPSSVQLSLMKKWKVNVSDLQNFLGNFQPDIIHTHLFEAELVSRFCIYPKAKWFSHVHDNMVQLKNWSWSSITKKNITNWYEKQILIKKYKKNGGTHFIAIAKHSEAYMKLVQQQYPITLLHNAINVKRFVKTGNYSMSPSNSSSHTLNLINIGSFAPKKNQTFILDIILELNKRGQKVNCIFLGDGLLKQKEINRAKQLKIFDQCEFKGNVEDVEEFLWLSDIYVHTATYEPLGLVLIEAMAAGLPVVTLDGRGNRDLMRNGDNGYIIEKQDASLFAEKIILASTNRIMSNFSINFSKQFNIQSYCEKLLKLYQV